jgi:hypothetical protein
VGKRNNGGVWQSCHTPPFTPQARDGVTPNKPS